MLFVLPADPENLPIGGIASFFRGFVKFAPSDFTFGMIGASARRRLWRWCSVEVEDRMVQLLPVVRPGKGRRSIPIALRFSAALLANPRRVDTNGWILSFHRPGTDLAFGRHAGPMWRVVHLSVDDLATSGSESRWRRLPALLWRMEQRSFRRMDRIWIVNEQVARLYQARFPDVASRIEFLPNWVDATIFRPLDEHADEGGTLDVAGATKGPVVLLAGRLEGQKDPLLAARAFATFRSRHGSGTLVVAGDGGLKEAMRQELERLGALEATHFAGSLERTRLARIMRAADALLITSAFETGPTVGLEALSTGLPVVTTDVGEVAGIVARSGAGRVVPGRSPDALADAMEDLLAAPRSELTDICRDAVSRYDAASVLGRLYEVNRRLSTDDAGARRG